MLALECLFGVGHADPFQEIIDVLEMVVEGHAVQPAVVHYVCNGYFIKRFFNKEFLQ